ncbi:pyruvate decarboxylase isozyme, putative [Candida dubliniensis CD36]|uniref:Pyruvate decarboxylase isozyme, putative n=1 Tax=Candida dubliniensis (strain CD36 / ATCC MYA-646 / CBS 7987 / NCPF 3949 / NRRL Y-17841) TaxID=573826 RepID=B9WFN5_CANDC|nr:pyruvate decarboxylase isozyme, putative [Candida dubliniensis CD36]CAX42054.1 pyruvate decarboxylase isozyme, putative [Candida dubliniensis CD36]
MGEISLGRYIFERLYQLNVHTVFGVPGDFNLSLLDKIYETENEHGGGSFIWAGNCNELNAAYSADGYSRVNRGKIGALVTTFGVGELSALNGVAGSYAEHVGIVHIVGVPSNEAQKKQMLLHHTLGNGDFTVFHKMSMNICETTAFLDDLATACNEIDRCLRTAYTMQRPVYIAVPSNMVDMKVPQAMLDKSIDLSLEPNNVQSQNEVIDRILGMVSKASNPIVLVDACASRHDCKKEVKQLVEVTQFPVYVTPMGKGMIDEGGIGGEDLADASAFKNLAADLSSGTSVASRYGGVYIGSLSKPEVKEGVENSDLILSCGALLSDFNTGSFSYSIGTKNVVEFHSDHAKIRSAIYPGIKMKELMQALNKKISSVLINYVPKSVPRVKLVNTPTEVSAPLTQAWFWTRVSSWFKEEDIIITESGTAAHGILEARFPNNVVGISQILWGSIGYSVGATLGASVAAKEVDPKKRVILFVGDGSLQLTMQEISTMIKNGVNPYIFVVNNCGYTIEKLIHGLNAKYNNIQPWNHLQILSLFNAKDNQSVKISTVGEADDLFRSKDFGVNNKIRLIELMFSPLDAPKALVQQAKAAADVNRGNVL